MTLDSFAELFEEFLLELEEGEGSCFTLDASKRLERFVRDAVL